MKDSELVLVLDCQLEQQSVSVLVHMLDKEMDNELDLGLVLLFHIYILWHIFQIHCYILR